jgi:cytochrome P450
MLLSNAPEVVQKLREEHTKVFHKDFNQTMDLLLESPTKLEELEYTAAVIKETLRLFPVGYSAREADPGQVTVPNLESHAC